MKGVLTQSRRVRRGADASGGGGGRKLLLLFSANPAALREEWFLHDLAGIGFSETRRPILRSTPNSRVFRSVSSTAVWLKPIPATSPCHRNCITTCRFLFPGLAPQRPCSLVSWRSTLSR